MHTVDVSWMIGAVALERRRRRLEARKEGAESVPSPPAEHPLLGLGGRSIELSLGADRPIDANAFELAVDELHDHVLREDEPSATLQVSAAWLSSLAEIDRMPPEARETLREDLERLRRGPS
ncbi:hypothetical protein ABH923_001233 [Leifsonia sp. EB41]|uniref:hypothetical protein n=1 Tax=Leifsonia sp. EB41 TaxID=3156260 RepID=UPI0035119A69